MTEAPLSGADRPGPADQLRLTTATPLDLSARALVVAPQLIGAVLELDDVALQITEVEAYEGLDDPASHAWRGPTPRSQIMFGPSGRVYVYRSYGIHHATNLVCGPDGVASAVLIRAGRIIAGIERARARRGTDDNRLARGPGNLTRALGVGSEHNGTALIRQVAGSEPQRELSCGPRVGVSRAADRPWRFWWRDEATVSAYRRSPRAFLA